MSKNSSSEPVQKEREAPGPARDSAARDSAAGDSSSESREYSEGTQILQEMERGFTRASYRFAKGFAEGIRTYYEESERSAEKKQDGAARDFFQNSAAGFSVAMEEMSKAPYEIAKATDSDAAWEFAQSMGKSVNRVFRPDDKKEKKTGEDKGDAGSDK